MYCVIDNYDSYVYNLIAYMKEIGMKIKIIGYVSYLRDRYDIKTTTP